MKRMHEYEREGENDICGDGKGSLV